MVGKSMRTNDSFSGEITSRRKNGEEFPSRVSAVMLRDKHGSVMGSVGYSRDLTQERAAEKIHQELAVVKATEEMKKDVENIVRHDLKSPVNGMIGFTELLLADESISEESRESISLIRELGYRTINMVNLSLGMVKMEKGTYQLDPKAMNLLALLRGILSDIASSISYKRLNVELFIDQQIATEKDICMAYGEELLSYSLFANLLKNAVEASPRKGTLNINLTTGGKTSVAIHNGGAVPEEVRENFFDKYATCGKSTGTGLGTYSAKLITETQQGKISMQSSEQDGTTITVILPKF